VIGRWFGLLAVSVLMAGPATAGGLLLEGDLVQGGLVIGRADAGSKVSIDGSSLPVTDGGVFLIGFGRDANARSILTVTGADGTTETRELAVRSREYKVQRIDGLPENKVTPKPEDIAHIQADNARIGEARGRKTLDPYFMSGFGWPVTGPVSGVFGSLRILNGKPKNPHNGTDIAAPQGTLIVAPADAVVALAAGDMFYTGMTVMLDHGLGLTSVYAHMSEIMVAEGATITKGTAIGKVGKTGRVTGPHLHWGVTLGRTHLDPALLAGTMPNG